ncbi:MAG: DUF5685 family protein [Eubacterium sp.]|nr:DUF5685 family protein [Eubacterium sp.]
MFGYINANKQDLSKKDMEIYQSYYCGLCRVLSKRGGRKGQMLLNYDVAFLVILLTGLYELEDSRDRLICPMHPATRRTYRINEATEYAADMNILLSYQNFADDYRDEGSARKRFLMKMFRKDYERIFAAYPRQGRAIEKCMRELWEAEERHEDNIDVVAGITGEMLAEIFVWKEKGMWANELRNMGFYMGKFIYLMDAYEDVEKDCRNGNYNVLAKTYRNDREEFDTFSRLLLTSMLGECAKTFERMPVVLHASIIRNILYSGIWTRFEMVYSKRHRDETRKDRKKQKRIARLEKTKTYH